MTTDYPIIAYNNLLDGLQDGTVTYAFTVGTDNTAAPFTNVSNKDKINPALPLSDAAGGASITISLPTATAAQCLIIGADRHDGAGFKTTGGTFALDYWNGAAWVSLIAATALTAANTSTIYKLAAHTLGLSGGVYQYRIVYAGFTALSNFSIPELYLGTYLEMPPVDFGFDEYNEVYRGSKFDSLSGRIYKTLHYRRLELDPSWSVLERSTYDVLLNAFREDALELLKPFWFAWKPDTAPDEVYFGIHDGDNAAYQIKTAVHRSFKLKFIETV